jgi:hypothetical protein
MKYAVEMGSGVMIYIPSFIKTRSGIEMEGVHRQHGDIIKLLLVFQNMQSRVKKIGEIVSASLQKWPILRSVSFSFAEFVTASVGGSGGP